MKRMLLTAFLSAGLLAACGGAQAGTPTTPTPSGPVKNDSQIIAEAKVVPVQWAALSFPIGGTVAEVLVNESDTVSSGQVIARLDHATQVVNLERAEAQLKSAQARLQDLKDGPREEDIAAAEAQVRQAQAQLKQTLASVTPEDIAAARSQVDAAQATLGQLRGGTNSAEVRAVQAQLEQAQASLSGQRDQLSAGKTTAELQLSQAADRLVQAQTAYSTAKWHWEHVQTHATDPINPSTPGSSGKAKANRLNETQKQQYHDAFIQAERNLHSAEVAVEQAKVAAESAHQAEIDGLRTAEASVNSAQVNLERTTGAVLNEQAAQARAQLAQARASLVHLGGSQRENEIALAQSGVEAAQANMARVTSPPQPSELAALEAQVEAARAERDAAKLQLDQTELKAPFDGRLAALNMRVGEAIDANAEVAQLADTSAWQIETTDLTELNVAQVQPGSRVVLTFDALPGVTLAGHVLRVKELGENHQGDIVYRAIVVPEKADSRLRWNMTAAAAISPSSTATGAATTQP